MKVYEELEQELKKLKHELDAFPDAYSKGHILVMEKVYAIEEIIFFCENFWVWFENSEEVKHQYELYTKRKVETTKSKDQIRSSNYRFDKKMKKEIGECTIESIMNSQTVEEVKETMKTFRETSNVRNMKRSFMIDFIETIRSGAVNLSFKEAVDEFIKVKDKRSDNYGGWDNWKIKMFTLMCFNDENVMLTTKALDKCLNGEANTSHLLKAMEEDLFNMDKKVVDQQ